MNGYENSKPVKEYRVGGVSAAIWRNEIEEDGQIRIRYSIKLQSRYKSRKTDEWENAKYYTPQSLSKLLIVARKAQEYCLLHESKEADEAIPV